MTKQDLHVVFGSGQIGTRIATQLLAAGTRVRIVSRTPSPPQGAESAAGDARDQAFAAEAAAGASVIYDTTNPLYHHWKRDLLALGAGPLHAAKVTGAQLVALDCLYMYGAPTGPMTETTPMVPVAKKGVLRKELAELRLGAVARGEAHVAIARASDFFGPRLPNSWWSERFFRRVLAGKAGECVGDPDQRHSYTYAEDVARAMVALGGATDIDGIWHVPTVAAETTRQLADRVGRALDVKITLKPIPRLVLRGLGLFAPFMGEVPEMIYQFEMPYVLDDTKFRARFDLTPTPIETQVAETVAWAREQLSARAAA
ncbi:MAG: NAD-dependent epimerase/dehydratase family protein [Myxococcales bacterium]|nr:NAD-dependent epimerase/dehydratase family protein [Myxococcales bacterium]